MRLLRWIQPFLWVTSAFAVAYIAWVFTGRLLEHKKLERRAIRLAPSTPEFDRIYGGSALKILQFYARDGEIAPSQKTLLCYGVLNATSIRIDPVMDGLRPSVNNCLEISPAKTTSYTLVAQGAGGSTASQSVTVRVNPR